MMHYMSVIKSTSVGIGAVDRPFSRTWQRPTKDCSRCDQYLRQTNQYRNRERINEERITLYSNFSNQYLAKPYEGFRLLLLLGISLSRIAQHLELFESAVWERDYSSGATPSVSSILMQYNYIQ